MRAHLVVAVTVLACSHPHPHLPMQPIPAPAIVHLDNGLTLSLRPDPSLAVANVRMIVHTGWADDPAERTGMASLVVELMHEASAAPGKRSFGDRIGDVSLWNDGDVDPDQTGFAAIVLPEHIEDVLAIDAARAGLDCGAIEPAALSRAAAAASAYASGPGRPDDNAVIAAFGAGAFGAGHPYARDQSALAIDDVTPQEVCRYLDESWGADRLEVIVSGNFDPARTERAVRHLLASARVARGPRTIPPAAWTTDRDELVANIGETAIVVSLPAPEDPNDATAASVVVANAASRLEGRFGITRTTAGTIGTGSTARLAVVASLSDARELEAAIEAVYESMPRAIEDNAARVAHYQAKPDHGAVDLDSFDDVWTTTDEEVFTRFELRATYVSAGQWMAAHLTRTQTHLTVVRPSGVTATAPRLGSRFPGALALAPRRHRAAHLEAPRVPLIAGDVRTLPNGMRVALVARPGAKRDRATLAFPIGERDYAGAELAAAYLTLGEIENNVIGDANDRITAFNTSDPEPEVVVSKLSALLHVHQLEPPKRKPRVEQRTNDDDGAVATMRCTMMRANVFTEARGVVARASSSGDARKRRLTWGQYQPRNASLALVGDFDPDQMMRLVVRWFGGGRGAELPPPQRRVVSLSPRWLGMEASDGTPASYAVSFRAESDPLADRAARLVLSQLIADRAGRAHYDFPDPDESVTTVGSFIAANAAKDIRESLARLETVRSDPAALGDAVAIAKQAALLDLFEYVASRWTASGAIADALASGKQLDWYDQLAKQIIDLAPEELGRVARLDLDPAHMVVAARGNHADVEAVLLAAGAKPEAIQWKTVPSCP